MDEIDPNLQVKPSEAFEIAFAVRKLGEALSSRQVVLAIRHVQEAQHNLSAFINQFVPQPIINKKEAELSSALHAYMRKGMDSKLSVILYRMVNDGRGIGAWFNFVKGLAAHKMNFREGMEAAEAYTRKSGNGTEDVVMCAALWMWEEDFPDAVQWLKA